MDQGLGQPKSKQPRLAKALAKGEVSVEWIVEGTRVSGAPSRPATTSGAVVGPAHVSLLSSLQNPEGAAPRSYLKQVDLRGAQGDGEGAGDQVRGGWQLSPSSGIVGAEKNHLVPPAHSSCSWGSNDSALLTLIWDVSAGPSLLPSSQGAGTARLLPPPIFTSLT